MTTSRGLYTDFKLHFKLISAAQVEKWCQNGHIFEKPNRTYHFSSSKAVKVSGSAHNQNQKYLISYLAYEALHANIQARDDDINTYQFQLCQIQLLGMITATDFILLCSDQTVLYNCRGTVQG